MLAFGITACSNSNSNNNPVGPGSDSDPDPDNTQESNSTIVQELREHDDLSVLAQAIIDAELESTLDSDGPYTILAPTNTAFDNLPDYIDIDNMDQSALEELISYNILSQRMSSDELSEQDTLHTVQETPIFVRTSDGNVELNRGPLHGGATLGESDIEVTNAVVHKINEVLIPDTYLDVLAIADKRYNLTKFVCSCTTGETGLQPILEDRDAEFTVFIPTDDAFAEFNADARSTEELRSVLEYHIVEEQILSDDLSDGQMLQTMNGASLTVSVAEDGNITLDDGAAAVLAVDLQGVNGVVYIIDSVLTPPEN